MSAVAIVFAIASGLGLALGLWGEFSEQRRLGRMAHACKKGRGRS